MKNALAAVTAVALFALVGCDKGTPGGPGASNSASNTSKNPLKKLGTADETFEIKPPTFSTSLKQGETKQVEIAIKKGKNFSDDITVTFEGLPKGVTIEPASPKIPHGDDSVKVKIVVADDASTGDFTPEIVAKPSKGDAAKHKLKLTIKKK